MPQVFGLSDKGFKVKKFSDIKDEIEAKFRTEIDPTLRCGHDSIAGVISAIVANQACQVWESLSGLYHSLRPDTASGRSLDALCSLTGTYREKAARSRAIAVLTLEPQAKVPKDSLFQTLSGHLFKVIKEVINESNVRADIEADLIAQDFGPIIAHPDTAAKIMTPVAGFSESKFKRTHEVGRLDETDDELKFRRFNELNATGASTVEAIKTRLSKIAHVEAVYIKEGVHSFEAIVKGGKDHEIAQVLWYCKPLGISTTGTIECSVFDSMGEARKIRFSRPTEINLSLHANLKLKRRLDDTELNEIKNSLVDFSKKLFALGAEVYASRFFTALFAHMQVLDVITLQLRECATGNVAPTLIKPEQIASLAFEDIHIEQIVENAQ